MSSPQKRSYQPWSLEEDLRLYQYAICAHENKQPLSQLFSDVAPEFGRKPQTIAQHYYAEVKPRSSEFEKIVGSQESKEEETGNALDQNAYSQDPVAHQRLESGTIGFPKEGAVVEGTVENIASFGVFVRLDNELKGLLHISQISKDFVEDIHALFSIGQRLRVKVENIDANGRLSFSTIGLNTQTGRKKTHVSDTAWQHEWPTTSTNTISHTLILAEYCQLQDHLRQLQVQTLKLQRLLIDFNKEDELTRKIKGFVEKCLSI